MRLWMATCLLIIACMICLGVAQAQRGGGGGCCGGAPGCCGGYGGWGRPYPGPVAGVWGPSIVIAPTIPIRPPPISPPVQVAPAVVMPLPPAGVTYGMPAAQFVYWCDNPSGYYPNVPTCNGPWREQSATQPR